MRMRLGNVTFGWCCRIHLLAFKVDTWMGGRAFKGHEGVDVIDFFGSDGRWLVDFALFSVSGIPSFRELVEILILV